MRVLLVVPALFGCLSGGDGDDNGDGGQRAPEFPTAVTYSIGNGGLILSTDDTTLRVRLGLEGIFRKNSRSYTLAHAPVARFYVEPLTPAGAPWAIVVLDTLQWDYGKPPTSGALRVGIGNYVDIRVNNTVNGIPQAGVDLAYVAFGKLVATSSFTWPDFEGLKDDPEAEPYQIQALIGYHLLHRVYDHVQTLMEQYQYLTLNDVALQAAGSGVGLISPCSLYAPTGTTGSFHPVWFDGPGEQSGELGPADRFVFTYTECYNDRPSEVPGRLYTSGGVRWNNYVESASPFLLGASDTRFENLRSTRTIVDPTGAVVPGETVLANSFGMVNEQPDTGIGFSVLLSPDTSTPINSSNAIQVAGVGISSLQLPRQVGALAVDLALGVLKGVPVDFCDSGGYSVNVPPAPLGPGHEVTIIFTNCVSTTLDPDPAIFTGSVTFEVESVSGDPAGDTYSLQVILDPINVTTADAIGTTTISGAMRFRRTATSGDFTEQSQSVAGTPLRVSETEGGATVTRDLSGFSIASDLATTGAYSIGAPGDVMLITASNLAGEIVLQMIGALQGTEPAPPASGGFRMTAGGNSLTLGVGVSGTVTLAVDENGDGTTDVTIPTTWDELD